MCLWGHFCRGGWWCGLGFFFCFGVLFCLCVCVFVVCVMRCLVQCRAGQGREVKQNRIELNGMGRKVRGVRSFDSKSFPFLFSLFLFLCLVDVCFRIHIPYPLSHPTHPTHLVYPPHPPTSSIPPPHISSQGLTLSSHAPFPFPHPSPHGRWGTAIEASYAPWRCCFLWF